MTNKKNEDSQQASGQANASGTDFILGNKAYEDQLESLKMLLPGCHPWIFCPNWLMSGSAPEYLYYSHMKVFQKVNSKMELNHKFIKDELSLKFSNSFSMYRLKIFYK